MNDLKIAEQCIPKECKDDLVSRRQVYCLKLASESDLEFGQVLIDMPTAQPEQKKGEWEEIAIIPEAYDIAGVKTWASKMRCNQCSFTTYAVEGHFAQYNYCPSCGADMRGKHDGQERSD